MMLSGDEFGNTQFGNNNAYCQDNEISWIDWSLAEKNNDMFKYVKNLIAFRHAHPVMRCGGFDSGENGTGYPELSFHGCEPWKLDRCAPSLVFAYMYAEDHEKYDTKKDCFIYVMVNAHWESHVFTLPVVPKGYEWYLVSESGGRSYAPGKEKKMGSITEWKLDERMSAILMAR